MHRQFQRPHLLPRTPLAISNIRLILVNEFSKQQLSSFFSSIASWRQAYQQARLHFLAVRHNDDLTLVAARIYLDVGRSSPCKPHFKAGAVEAGQWDIPQEQLSIEQAIQAMVGPGGLTIKDVGTLRLANDHPDEPYIAPPTLLHAEGLNTGNRLGVLSITGAHRTQYLPQPEIDWLLKGADVPYDTVNELCTNYELGILRGDRSLIEIVARSAIEVLARSEVKGTSAKLGIWMASNLNREKVKIGYRVLEGGQVVARGAVPGVSMTWSEEGIALVGTTDLQVAVGAIVQCVASYDGHAHHVLWRSDPELFQNPRAVLLSMVDQTQQIVRGYLQPELPPKGSKAADEFEAAICWLLWTLGFSTATFGTTAKTRDSFDIVAATPSGDLLVVECTLGLLRADSKLSKLAARAAGLREKLDTSNLKYIRVLPAIVTALTAEQVAVDVPQAEEIGILVLTSESFDDAFNELLRFPDANSLFERAMVLVQDKKSARINMSNRK